MRPSSEWEGKLARVSGFIQRAPDDGKPATQETEAYLGYDERNLYVIFVAHDSEPQKIRARLGRREGIRLDEDQVGFYLDTFHDKRRAYQFECNPLGIQYDSIYSDDTGIDDDSFDTVWQSQGKLTSQGFVVWFSIPFKSLRFSHAASQTWGIAIWRWISRRSEGAWWPRNSSKMRGFLGQEGTMTGLEEISPGRNLQFIPYVSWRAFHTVDSRDPVHPAYIGKRADIAGGVDSKIILKDSLVLDLTAKPDFSQVESDEPQTTVNQRFEVFFPEKRPFFTENASFFDVTMMGDNRLLFTRRIAHPDYGARLTGKLGPYSIGALFADDRSPGERVPHGDPVEGRRAYFGVLRITHDLPRQSNFGGMYTERFFEGSYNRVLDLDGTLRLTKTWTATALGAEGWTRTPDGLNVNGKYVEARLNRESRGFNYNLQYLQVAPGFRADAGFIFRNDLRTVTQKLFYSFWPQRWLTNIKPQLYLEKGWFYNGGDSFATINPSLTFELNHQSTLTLYSWHWHDVLRPKDYALLPQAASFPERAYGLSVSSSQSRWVTLSALYEWGTRLNYVPPADHPPGLADYNIGRAGISVRPSRGLIIDNSYLFDRNLNRADRAAVYNSHILRSKWNWQLNRELSLRFIAQYNALLGNPVLTSAPTSRRFNTDFLITYLVHPGTAIYVGYNSNLSRPGPPVVGPAPDRFVNDGRQFFVKASYLFRF